MIKCIFTNNFSYVQLLTWTKRQTHNHTFSKLRTVQPRKYHISKRRIPLPSTLIFRERGNNTLEWSRCSVSVWQRAPSVSKGLSTLLIFHCWGQEVPLPLPFSAETFSLKPEQQLHLKKVQNKALMSTWRAFFPAFNKILSHRRLLTYWCLTPERFTARHNPLTGSMQICGDGPQGCKTDTFFCSVAPGWLWGYFFYLGGGGKAALDEGIVGIRGVQQFCSGSFFSVLQPEGVPQFTHWKHFI